MPSARVDRSEIFSALRRTAGEIRRALARILTRTIPAERLIIIAAIGLATAITGSVVVMVTLSYREVLTDAERRTQDFADVLAEHAMLVFDDIDRTLQAANRARDLLIRDGHWGPEAGDRPYRALLELRPSAGAASNLSWTDENGDRLYTALSRHPPPLNVATRRYFTKHRDDPSIGLFVDKPNLSGLTGRHLVPVTRRFDLPDGRFGGVTTLLVDPFYFSTFYQSTTRRQRLFIQLTLTDGTVLVREPSAVSIAGSSIASGVLFTEHLPKAPSGTFATASAIDGVERIVSYKPIPKLPLVISVSINKEHALAEWHQEVLVLLVFYVSLLGMIGGIAWLGLLQLRQRARRQREQELATERQRQAEKYQALSTLVGGIAHEVNNALLPIMTFGEMVEETLAEGSFERDAVGRMRRSSEQIDKLIQRVLSFSREEERASLELDLGGFVNRLHESLRQDLPKNIALARRVDPAVGTVVAPEDMLKQVFTDLVTNAAHAIGSGPGNIEIAASPAFERDGSTATPGEDGFVRIDVTDDGPGIPPLVRQRLFEPFFTTKEAGSGVGLGLYTARRVVSELGGYLDVASEPGKGACFSVYLRRAFAQ